jgi:serine protease DegQ
MNARQLSDSFASAVDTAASHVVRVDARRRIGSSGLAWGDGLVLTAAHTVERDGDITVGLADGRSLPATSVGSDPTTDITVLRLGEAVPTATWREVPPPAVGHLVLAVGRPNRVRASVSIVTSRGEGWRTHGGGSVDAWVETDLGPWPGFSGSAAVDADGGLLGMNTAGFGRRSLVIPVATLRRVADEIAAHGRVPKAFLGIGTHPVRLGPAIATQTGQATALLIDSVAPGSPAETAGLLLGDALLSFDGQPVEGVEDLLGRLGPALVGKGVPVRILRAGQVVDLVVTVGSR